MRIGWISFLSSENSWCQRRKRLRLPNIWSTPLLKNNHVAHLPSTRTKPRCTGEPQTERGLLRLLSAAGRVWCPSRRIFAPRLFVLPVSQPRHASPAVSSEAYKHLHFIRYQVLLSHCKGAGDCLFLAEYFTWFSLWQSLKKRDLSRMTPNTTKIWK